MPALQKQHGKAVRKKLNTEAEVEKVCFLYYDTAMSMNAIAWRFRVSWTVVQRVLATHGKEYLLRNPR